jgi:outer membrane protein assembly factor BamB
MRLTGWPGRVLSARASASAALASRGPGSGLLAILAMLAVAGCSSTKDSAPDWAGVKGDTEPTALVEFHQTAKFEVRWHANVGDSGTNPQQPAVTKDAVYGVSGKGALTRLDRATGKQVWRIETGLVVSSGGVASGEGLVLVGGDKGDVQAYGEDGKLRWKSTVSSEVLNVSSVVDGMVLVRTGDGHVAGLGATDGKRIWLYERTTPALVVRSHAGVVIQRGVAYAGFAGGKLAAINIKNGEVVWESIVSQPTGNTELERISDITSDPVVDDEQVCAISFQGRVACFSIAQGGPLWNRDISGDKGLMELRRYIYLADSQGAVIALDKTSGGTLWKNDQLLLRGVTAPYALDAFVVVGDYKGYLYGLNREDGSLAARIQLDGGAIWTPPQELDGGFLVQTSGGELYSLTIH